MTWRDGSCPSARRRLGSLRQTCSGWYRPKGRESRWTRLHYTGLCRARGLQCPTTSSDRSDRDQRRNHPVGYVPVDTSGRPDGYAEETDETGLGPGTGTFRRRIPQPTRHPYDFVVSLDLLSSTSLLGPVVREFGDSPGRVPRTPRHVECRRSRCRVGSSVSYTPVSFLSPLCRLPTPVAVLFRFSGTDDTVVSSVEGRRPRRIRSGVLLDLRRRLPEGRVGGPSV